MCIYLRHIRIKTIHKPLSSIKTVGFQFRVLSWTFGNGVDWIGAWSGWWRWWNQLDENRSHIESAFRIALWSNRVGNKKLVGLADSASPDENTRGPACFWSSITRLAHQPFCFPLLSIPISGLYWSTSTRYEFDGPQWFGGLYSVHFIYSPTVSFQELIQEIVEYTL